MRIISASRRTDIPAFHSDWFMQRIDEGSVRWRNPFGGQEIETSLLPEDVAAIVFWSRDYRPMLPNLRGLHRRGYRFLFHFTITGLPNIFEPQVPDAEVAISTAMELADEYGADALLWRYDPALISSITPADYHLNRFNELAAQLKGYTSRCYFSFPTFYGKVVRRAGQLKQRTGVECIDPPVEQKLELASNLAEIAASAGVRMFSCCGDYLVSELISRAHCVDAELLQHLYPDRTISQKLKGTRIQCGCYESTDIGAYGTCGHGCVYCYANK